MPLMTSDERATHVCITVAFRLVPDSARLFQSRDPDPSNFA